MKNKNCLVSNNVYFDEKICHGLNDINKVWGSKAMLCRNEALKIG